MTSYSSIILEKEIPGEKSTSFVRELLFSLVVISPLIPSGMTVAFPAIALPQLQLNINDASWFGSIYFLCSPIGTFLVGLTIDKYGRRTALLLSTLPGTLGWILSSFCSDVSALLAAQALIGIAYGSIGYPSLVYAGECILVGRVKWRNHFATFSGVITALGVFLTYLLGYYFRYQRVAQLVASASLASFVALYLFVPESPSWLRRRGRFLRAAESEAKLGLRQPILRTTSDASADPWPVVGPADVPRRWSDLKSGLKKIKRRDVRKPLLRLSAIYMLMTLSGASVLVVYMVDILQNSYSAEEGPGVNSTAAFSAKITVVESYRYSVVSGALILLANVLVAGVAGACGVKRLNVFAHCGACVGMISLGYATVNAGRTAEAVRVTAVWLVTFMFNLGPMNLAVSVIGDVFPADAKGFASASVMVPTVTAAVVNKLYPYLVNMYGGYLYYAYASLCALNAFLCYLFFPEIMGKTLEQINEAFL